jgi:hypothetical protein
MADIALLEVAVRACVRACVCHAVLRHTLSVCQLLSCASRLPRHTASSTQPL